MASSIGRYQRTSPTIVAQNNAGTPVEMYPDGPILFANLFNGSAYDHIIEEYGLYGRVFYSQVDCLPQTADGCFPIRFATNNGRPPAVRSDRVNAVRSYGEAILAGTKFGIPQESRGSQQNQWSTSSTGVAFTDQARTAQISCFPAFTSDRPAVQLAVDIDEFGIDNNPERDVMIETWFHDTKWQELDPADNIWGTINNIHGTQCEAREDPWTGSCGVNPDTIQWGGLQRGKYNNVLLEAMIHIGPISGVNNLYQDAAGGSQNPAQAYCSFIDIGDFRWEIWFGCNGYAPLVVFNRIGPSGCAGAGCATDLTNEGLIDVPYDEIMDYILDPVNGLEAQLLSCRAQDVVDAGFWAVPTSELYPFARMREANRTVMSGVEIGYEPYYNGSDDAELGMTLNRVDLTIDGKNLGTCLNVTPPETGACLLPVEFGGVGEIGCLLPVEFTGGCPLPIVFQGEGISLAPVDCGSCPVYTDHPRIVTTYGGEPQGIDPTNFADFPEGTVFEVLDVRSNGISGDVVQSELGAIYTPPASDSSCLIECGTLSIQYTYRCPGVEFSFLTCSLTVNVCTIPDHEVLADEEIIVETGSTVLIAASPQIFGETIQPPVIGPPAGDLVWNGSGWQFIYPEGLIGRFELVVPNSPHGDKANDLRCVTVCLTGGKSRKVSERNCEMALAVKDKGGQYRPIATISSAGMNISQEGGDTAVDFDTGFICITDADGGNWSMSLVAELQVGENPLQSGTNVEIKLIKDIRYANPPCFYGTARVQDFSTDYSEGERTFGVSLVGHGPFYATNWIY